MRTPITSACSSAPEHATERDGYRGWISLETHWGGPNGDKLAGSVICGQNLARLVQ
jgi:hypothetical protein